jgi:phosphoglucomutase
MDVDRVLKITAAAGDVSAARIFSGKTGPVGEDLFRRIEEGIGGLEGIDSALKERAAANLREWLTAERFGAYLPQLLDMIEKERFDFLLDSFYQVIPFGTGGRRGPIGAGTNRINPYTVATSVMGHVLYLRDRFPDAGPEGLGVVIACDVRVFNDSRGRYNPDLFDPLLGITSRDLARVAAQVYAAQGVCVHMLPADSDEYISTPELSFLIRKLGVQGGLNISASHNHPDDNGGKFYNAHGGQEIPPDDEKMARMVEGVTDVSLVGFDEAVAKGLVRFIGPDARQAYIDLNLALSLAPRARSARVVFTPLNGTGRTTVGRVLEAAGFSVDLVADQADFDGNFPNVPFRIPNPEVPESMEAACALADEKDADIVLSTDPDADRLGAMTRLPGGGWKFVTGNEIAAVLARFILGERRKAGTLSSSPVLIKTEVTTDLIAGIAESFGARCVGNLLVGFKYIGELIRQMEEEGRCGDLKADYADFVMGTEESHGLLVTPDIRDKDAAGGALALVELVSLLKNEGRTLHDYLLDIYREQGGYANALVPLVMEGARGVANIERIQDAFRRKPPTEIDGLSVENHVDHWDESGVFGPIQSETDRASRNVLVFRLAGGERVAMRPSGTEPKTKIYVEVRSDPMPGKSDAEVLDVLEDLGVRAQSLADDLTRKALAVIGEELPDFALRISGLVSVNKKKDFAENLIPELEERAAALLDGSLDRAGAKTWLDERLASYGKDPRGLVARAFGLYMAKALAAAENAGETQKKRNLEAQMEIFETSDQGP